VATQPKSGQFVRAVQRIARVAIPRRLQVLDPLDNLKMPRR
jgi:hypothetical protein